MTRVNLFCRACAAPTDAYLCKHCTDKLRRVLAELPADLRDLQLVATRQAAGPLGVNRYRLWDGPYEADALGDAPWDFAPAAADQIWSASNTITTWARHLAETRHVPGPIAQRGRTDTVRHLTIVRNRATWRTWRIFTPSPEQPLTTVITWLLDNLDSIRLDEAAGQILDEFAGLHEENEAWTFGRSTIEEFAGTCDATQVGFELDQAGTLIPIAAQCGVPMYGRQGEEYVRCTACGTKYELQPRLDEIRSERINERLATAHMIADALTTLEEPMGRELLRKWIQRDALRLPAQEGPACETCKHSTCRSIRRPPIHPRGIQDGHPVYRFGDVRRRLALVQEQRGVKLSV